MLCQDIAVSFPYSRSTTSISRNQFHQGNGLIYIGIQRDQLQNSIQDFWNTINNSGKVSKNILIDSNVGTIEYDMETESYIINDFDEAVKLTYDGSKIKLYNERGISPTYFDGYAVRN